MEAVLERGKKLTKAVPFVFHVSETPVSRLRDVLARSSYLFSLPMVCRLLRRCGLSTTPCDPPPSFLRNCPHPEGS